MEILDNVLRVVEFPSIRIVPFQVSGFFIYPDTSVLKVAIVLTGIEYVS